MPPAIIAAGIAGVATVGGALISSSASGKAAAAQTAAADASIAEQRRQYDTSREDLAPWRKAGAEGLQQYSSILSGEADPRMALEKYPGYQFALEQGTEAIGKSSSARRLGQSGQHLKDLTKYGQGLATTNFENYMNRLQGLSGAGQNATNSTATLGANAANQIGRSQQEAGQARATGYQNKAAAWGGALEGLATIGGDVFGGSGGTPDPLSSQVLGKGVYS